TFFTGTRLGLVLATVRFLALARTDLRALPRLVEFPLGGFPCFCTFDFFLRLAMISPASWCSATRTTRAGSKDNRSSSATDPITYQQLVCLAVSASRTLITVTKIHKRITVAEPSLEIWTSL